MSGDPRLVGRTPGGWWERWWPRFLGVGQFGLGAFVVVHETLSTSATERPALLGLATMAILGAPATTVLARYVSRK